MAEMNRFTEEPCNRCGWKYGKQFHVCIDPENPPVVVATKSGKKRKLTYAEEDDIGRTAEARVHRWSGHHEANQKRDEQIVKLRKQGFTFRQIAKQFGVHSNTIMRVVKRAEEKEIT